MEEWTGVYWNTRLIERKETWKAVDGKEYFTLHFDLHEVHYDKNHKPIAWTSDPITLKFSDIEDAKATIKHMKDALKRTILRQENDKLIDTKKLLKQYKESDLTNFEVTEEMENILNMEE